MAELLWAIAAPPPPSISIFTVRSPPEDRAVSKEHRRWPLSARRALPIEETLANMCSAPGARSVPPLCFARVTEDLGKP